jgi:hypothetical protein
MNPDNPHFGLYRRRLGVSFALVSPVLYLPRLHLVGVIPPMVGYHFPRFRSSYDLVSSGQRELEAHTAAYS